MKKWIAETYDDRDGHTIDREECYSEYDADCAARRLIDAWRDPDDNVKPCHLQSRTYEEDE